ncbi:MAG: ATP-binding cassette domain-containing protein [Magnetococcales bacterium]|nr:ATP-binding cassette domain-containing protein [Magnetococcales bacterium]
MSIAHVGPVSFAVDGGECIGVEGRSGSGKSLLLRALADLDPNTGEVVLDGESRSGMEAPLWRTRVGLLPAESRWWFETVEEHLQSCSALSDWLQRLGFEEDVVKWRVDRLSTGEKQRLSLARLLSRKPQALLLDEPTANLDATSSGWVESLISDYRTAFTVPVIWVGHDPQQLRRVASRVLTVEEGGLTGDCFGSTPTLQETTSGAPES